MALNIVRRYKNVIETRNQLTTTKTMIERDMSKHNLPILNTEN